MKAKHFILGNEQELQLANGVSFKPDSKESFDSLCKRISLEIKNDLSEDLEITMIDEKKIKSFDTKRALKALESATGLYARILSSLLISRGVAHTLPVLEIPAEVPKPADKKPAVDPVEKVPTEREIILAEFKKSKVYKDAKKNVGNKVTYLTRGLEGERKGIVKGLLIGKCLKKVYYMILNTDNGKRESCTTDNAIF